MQPRLIIHGGAGNITRDNLLPKAYAEYAAALRRIYQATSKLLAKGATALDAATYAVTLFEDCPLFNCGKGAVFTREGTIELEASVMVSRGYRKRGCGVVLVKRVKNPIKLAREMLVRGETDGTGGGNGGDGDPSGGSGGAQGHCCLGGETVERLAQEWGLEMVDPEHFWTKKRWDEHQRGLGENISRGRAPDMPVSQEGESGWDGKEYLPQGTVGCVALDQSGILCVATSTGGLTNKLPCRVGDTPTIGAGFWAEEWDETPVAIRNTKPQTSTQWAKTGVQSFACALKSAVDDCVPGLSTHQGVPYSSPWTTEKDQPKNNVRAVAMSGTGNGDSFLRLAAARTAGSIVRFSHDRSLASAVNQIAGPFGELQRSAADRWSKTGEGEGGIIGIEVRNGQGEVVFDFNCGGMFRCWVDELGKERVMVFRDEY